MPQAEWADGTHRGPHHHGRLAPPNATSCTYPTSSQRLLWPSDGHAAGCILVSSLLAFQVSRKLAVLWLISSSACGVVPRGSSTCSFPRIRMRWSAFNRRRSSLPLQNRAIHMMCPCELCVSVTPSEINIQCISSHRVPELSSSLETLIDRRTAPDAPGTAWWSWRSRRVRPDARVCSRSRTLHRRSVG